MELNHSDITGPEDWSRIYSSAAGARQSPVDIKPKTLQSARTGRKLRWRYSPTETSSITNTGHGWKVISQSSESEIADGPLNCEYELEQVHCHWGATDNEGSEHTINGQKFAGEVHLVHWNKTNYSSFEEATKHPDGLCVFAVFLKIGDFNKELEKVVEKIPNIQHKGQTVKLTSPLNPKMFLSEKSSYWTYMGSLTTPPYNECVIWIVFKEPVEVSSEQLQAFRTLRCHTSEECECNDVCKDQVLQNCRPTLSLGQRVILDCDP